MMMYCGDCGQRPHPLLPIRCAKSFDGKGYHRWQWAEMKTDNVTGAGTYSGAPVEYCRNCGVAKGLQGVHGCPGAGRFGGNHSWFTDTEARRLSVGGGNG